ncbi:MAG: HlyD family efflux transporter periplasmic adaptor subunit [Verrucomicrobiota bacterium]
MNAQLTKRGSLEGESEMLPQHPPPWIVRSLSLLLLAIFFVALLAAVLVHLPETVNCPFVLVPNEGADPIQSPRMATVSRVAVTEGQTVDRGAELFVLRSDEIPGPEMDSLKSDPESSPQNLLSIPAPYPAVVISLAKRNAGSVVRRGEELCQLARLEAKPRARLLLPQAGLPKLAVGQRARFFFEAFPYQRYGTVSARLDWISPSAVSSAEGSHFVALASLDEAIVPARQKPLSVRIGMKGEARIVVGRRTLMEYAFEPVQQLRESVR